MRWFCWALYCQPDFWPDTEPSWPIDQWLPPLWISWEAADWQLICNIVDMQQQSCPGHINLVLISSLPEYSPGQMLKSQCWLHESVMHTNLLHTCHVYIKARVKFRHQSVHYLIFGITLYLHTSLHSASFNVPLVNFFYVRGSVHLGNVYVRLEVQLDVLGFVCILYFIIFSVHVLGAICTHHQEHKLQSTAIDMRNGYGM
jgi:hypothetical protein